MILVCYRLGEAGMTWPPARWLPYRTLTMSPIKSHLWILRVIPRTIAHVYYILDSSLPVLIAYLLFRIAGLNLFVAADKAPPERL